MGGGSAGVMAMVGMVGPKLPSNSKSLSARAGEGHQAGGQQKKAPAPAIQAAPADAIIAESTLENASDARQIPGVPHAYRDLAEAYFRRLAQDAVGMKIEKQDESVKETKK